MKSVDANIRVTRVFPLKDIRADTYAARDTAKTLITVDMTVTIRLFRKYRPILSFVKIVMYPSKTHVSGSPNPPGVCLKELSRTQRMGYREIVSTNAISR